MRSARYLDEPQAEEERIAAEVEDAPLSHGTRRPGRKRARLSLERVMDKSPKRTRL